MSTEQKKSALVRLGYFGEASYTSIGEPYDNKRAERKAEEDGPAVFKLSTNPIKGKFSIMNGLFDPQGGVGTGVGSMYLHPQNAVAMRDMQSNLVPCLLACAPDLPVSSYAFDTLGTPTHTELSCPCIERNAPPEWTSYKCHTGTRH